MRAEMARLQGPTVLLDSPFPAPVLYVCLLFACPSSQPSSPMSLVGEASALVSVTLKAFGLRNW